MVHLLMRKKNQGNLARPNGRKGKKVITLRNANMNALLRELAVDVCIESRRCMKWTDYIPLRCLGTARASDAVTYESLHGSIARYAFYYTSRNLTTRFTSARFKENMQLATPQKEGRRKKNNRLNGYWNVESSRKLGCNLNALRKVFK